MTASNQLQERVLEGHFACGSGLLISIECLGHSYNTSTPNYEVSVSLPTLRREWQEGFLDPPAWTYRTSRDAKQDAEILDENFDWGVTAGFHNEPDGTQSPDYARVRRWRFETKIITTNFASDFFRVRANAVRELETWWVLISSWISIFTRQDFVEIGKTRSGMRVAPIVTWSGNEDGWRHNATIDTSAPIVSDDVEILNHAVLVGCMILAANGTEPPDGWLFIRDARSLVNARQYRRAVIDAGTAAELAMTALIDRKLAGMNFLQRERLLEKHQGLKKLSDLMAVHNAGTPPVRLQQELVEPRNKAAHEGASLSGVEANRAIVKAAELVEQLHPLASLLPPGP